jgi:serine/threonine protein kinase
MYNSNKNKHKKLSLRGGDYSKMESFLIKNGYEVVKRHEKPNERGGVLFQIKKGKNNYYVKVYSLNKEELKDNEYNLTYLASTLNLAPTVVEYLQDDKYNYLIIQKLVMTLEDFINSTSDLNEKVDTVKKVLPELISILTVLHDNSILHNDSTTSNFMIDAAGRYKLIDFGDSEYKKCLSREDKKGDYYSLYYSFIHSCGIPEDNEVLTPLRDKLETSSIVDNLISFYEENKDKIYIPAEDVGKYTINRKNIDRWIETVAKTSNRYTCKQKYLKYKQFSKETDDEELKQEYAMISEKARQNMECDRADHTDVYTLFAKLFSAFIRYIPFNEMLTKISNICIEINTISTDYDYIYLLINDEINKSNTWVALLYIGELLKLNYFNTFKDKIRIVSDKENIKDTILQDPEDEPLKYLVLHIDDMSYSGTQMNFTILNKQTIEGLNITWYLCVAYISTTAIQLFEDNKKIVSRFENTEVIPSFIEKIRKAVLDGLVKDTSGNPYTINSSIIRDLLFMLSRNKGTKLDAKDYDFFYGEEAWNCRNHQVAVYFDHKIADVVSVFQKIFNGGTFPSERENCFFISLINNCPIDPYKGEGCMLSENNRGLQTDIADDETCPKTFYKQFKYSYDCFTIKNVSDTTRKYPTLLEVLTNTNIVKKGDTILVKTEEKTEIDYNTFPPFSTSMAEAQKIFLSKYKDSSTSRNALDLWRQCRYEFREEDFNGTFTDPKCGQIPK